MGAIYIECSAKEGLGIQEVFDLAINTAVRAEEDSYELAVPGGAGNDQGGRKKKAKKRSCRIL